MSTNESQKIKANNDKYVSHSYIPLDPTGPKHRYDVEYGGGAFLITVRDPKTGDKLGTVGLPVELFHVMQLCYKESRKKCAK